MTLNLLIAYLKKLIEQKFTGQVRVNFHEGAMSYKVEKKDTEWLNKKDN